MRLRQSTFLDHDQPSKMLIGRIPAVSLIQAVAVTKCHNVHKRRKRSASTPAASGRNLSCGTSVTRTTSATSPTSVTAQKVVRQP